MNHKKFVSLLNLYIDGEIAPADAQEFQREIQANPERRSLYNDYCRIQRATRQAYESFRTAGAEPDGLGVPDIQRDGAALRFVRPEADGAPRGRSFRHARVWLGAGSVAACATAAVLAFSIAGRQAVADRETASSPVAEVAAVRDTPLPEVILAVETVSNTSIAAPLASEVRSDPYLLRFAQADLDPFSFTSLDTHQVGPVLDPSGLSSVITVSAPGDNVVQFEFGESIRLKPRTTPGIFRRATDAKPSPYTPIDYRTNP